MVKILKSIKEWRGSRDKRKKNERTGREIDISLSDGGKGYWL